MLYVEVIFLVAIAVSYLPPSMEAIVINVVSQSYTGAAVLVLTTYLLKDYLVALFTMPIFVLSSLYWVSALHKSWIFFTFYNDSTLKLFLSAGNGLAFDYSIGYIDAAIVTFIGHFFVEPVKIYLLSSTIGRVVFVMGDIATRIITTVFAFVIIMITFIDPTRIVTFYLFGAFYCSSFVSW